MKEQADQHANRLINEESPYLLQHAHNPVDWYPWGDEAFIRARSENKLILISIGYSSCHWCHVMERESFEDPDIAHLMNGHYICIKVDREERPDIDSVYQLCAQMMGVQGGWPLTAFLTPDLTPVFIGTYFPPRSMWGRPGFSNILTKIAETYLENPDKIIDISKNMKKAMKAQVSPPEEEAGNGAIDPAIIDDSIDYLADKFDRTYGGFGSAPKFPNTPILQLMLEAGAGEDDSYTRLALFTLEKMSQGGIYDHLGGGFHRYSTDRKWLIPHFEKMLYDNALLAQLYLDAYKLTGKKSYAVTAYETLDYLIRDMTSDAGAVFATEDADSDGQEGKYYVWTRAEILEILGATDGEYFCGLFGVTGQGNFENNTSVLSLSRPISEDEKDKVSKLKDILRQHRSHRVRPFRDEKIVAAWNGMAISAFAQGGSVLKNLEFIESAKRIWKFVEDNMMSADHVLIRSYKNRPSRTQGFLEDYAYITKGLLDLYAGTLDRSYLDTAKALALKALELFWDDGKKVLYSMCAPSSGSSSNLPIRHWDYSDGSVPNDAGIFIESMLKLKYYDAQIAGDIPEKLITSAFSAIESNPWSYCTMLRCFMRLVKGEVSIVFVETEDNAEKASGTLRELVASRFIPGLVLDRKTPADSDYRLLDGKDSAYVCKRGTCFPPVNDAVSLERLLEQPSL